jgi:RNA polymerase sigma-70 factor (ECF subfamily)
MSDEFRAYKSNPTSDNLIRLLRAHQDRVYRVCLQVLRRPHDAEDAAQEVLIRVVDGVRAFDDPDAFRRWLYRVSLNAALEAARKAARRRIHESRAAMTPPAAAPLDDESRRALFEGIAKLPDASRALLFDHHVEGETLESIAAREGVSPQAVSKRLERTREDLRRALPLAVALDWSRVFEPGLGAAPDLVTGAVLAKVAAGGGVVAAKSSISALALLAVFLLVTGTAITVTVRRTSAVEIPRAASSLGVEVPRETRQPASSIALPKAAVAENIAPQLSTPLGTRLTQFRKWWFAIKSEEGFVSMDDHQARAEFRERWDREHWDHVRGLKDLILENPEGFLAFLRDPDNEAVIADMTRTSLLDQTDDPMVWSRKPFHDYPPQLMTGLLDLLQTGSVAQRWTALNLMSGFDDVPQAYKNVYLALLDHENEELQRISITLVMLMVPMTPPLFAKLTALGNQSESATIRRRIVSTMATHPGPEAEAFVLDRMAVATDHDELRQIMFSLQSRYRGTPPLLEEPMARAVSEAMARNAYPLYELMTVATFLPGDRLKPILRQAMAKTREEWYREKLSAALERIDQGPFTRRELMKILDPPRD